MTGKRIHPVYIIGFLLFGFVIGVWISQFQLIVSSSNLWIITSTVLLSGAFITKTRLALVLALIGGFVLGGWRAGITYIDSLEIKKIIGTTQEIQGIVAEDTEYKSNGLNFMLSSIKINDKHYEGVIIVDTKSKLELKRGDELVIQGKLDKGFASFVAVIHDAKLLNLNQLSNYDSAIEIRDNFSDKIKQHINEPSSSLGLGFLFGQKNNLPSDLLLALQITGLTHIIVASGYNLTILVRIIRRLFLKISKYTSTIVTLFMILGFVSLTGFSPSMNRAAIVAMLSLGAWYYGRKIHPVLLILIAMAVTLAIDPSMAWGNLGWELSFLSFAGIMIVSPVITKYFYGDHKPKMLGRIVIETVSATMMTAPLIIFTFGYVSTVSIVTNILILPCIPFAMLGTFLTGLLGFINVNLGHFMGLITDSLFQYILTVINYFGGLDLSKLYFEINIAQLLTFYLCVAAGFLYMKIKTKTKLEDYNIVD